jgi:hypothetical protein
VHIHDTYRYHRGNGLSCHPTLGDRVSKVYSHHGTYQPSSIFQHIPFLLSTGVCRAVSMMLLYPTPRFRSASGLLYEGINADSVFLSFLQPSIIFIFYIHTTLFLSTDIHPYSTHLINHHDADLRKFPHSRC